MGKTTSTIPFNGSAEQEAKLMEVIAEHKSDKGALMPILQQAQEIYGYLPIEVQEIIAKEMDIPLEKIYGVVTFYSQFSLNPKGKYTISVCLLIIIIDNKLKTIIPHLPYVLERSRLIS